MSKITVYLTAYNLGPDADEAFFNTWFGYVADNIDGATGLDITVDKRAFTGRNAGGSDDTIEGATDEQRETIVLALEMLWESGCATNFANPEDTGYSCRDEDQAWG